MVQKARNADGLKPSLPLASARALEHEWERQRRQVGTLETRSCHTRIDTWKVLRAGLLHEYAGLGCEEIARRFDTTNGSVSRWVRLHRTYLREDGHYADIASDLLRVALARSHGLER